MTNLKPIDFTQTVTHSTKVLALGGHYFSNMRWSWGSINHQTKTVILRVWQHESVRLAHSSNNDGINDTIFYAHEDDDKRPANNERLKHLQAVEEGYRCYLLVCIPKDATAETWSIESFAQYLVKCPKQAPIKMLGHTYINAGSRNQVSFEQFASL